MRAEPPDTLTHHPGSIPATCRAAALVGPGRALDIIDVEIPRTIEQGAVLVRMTAATVCGTDVHVRDGAVDSARAKLNYPVILGHEMTGRIVEMGEGSRVDSVGQPLEVGDRIVWTHGMCGRCRSCVVDGQPSLCTHRRRYMSESASTYPYLNGGLAEYGYVYPTSGRVKVPDDVPDELAAASSCALRTVIHGFDRLGTLDERHTVVIQGAGPLGLFALSKAVVCGAARVIVIGGPRARLELAAKWGASSCIDVSEIASAQERVAALLDLTGGRGADVVVEMSGAVSAFGEGMSMLAAGGRYLIVGQAHTQTLPFNPSEIMYRQVTLIGSLSAGVDHYWRALQFLRSHADRFRWQDMLSSPRSLDQVNEAFDSMASWREIKPVVRFG
jgi:L-iditol 2-dehydrogenase